MKAITRRLRKLEDRFGPPVETESSRRLRERLEAGRRRVAELRGRPVQAPQRQNVTNVRPSMEAIVKILQSGRQRVASGQTPNIDPANVS
jgi:hypothetical protein